MSAIESFIQCAVKRSTGLCSDSFMSDADWAEAVEIVHKKGPVTPAEMFIYKRKYDEFAGRHLVDLVFELEIAYTVIQHLVDPTVKLHTTIETLPDGGIIVQCGDPK